MKTATATGSVASFWSPKPAAIKSLKVYFEPKQAGEGNPSPIDNVRPIEGWTGVNLFYAKSDYKIKPAPGSTLSYGVTWVVDEDGLVKATGTPTSYAGCKAGTITVNGDETIYAKIYGTLNNVTFNAPQLYDSTGKRIVVSLSDGVLPNGLDLSQYEDVKQVTINPKRAANGVEMNGGSCFVIVTKDVKPTINSSLIDFSSFGTIYGGYVDLITGELVATYYEFDFTADKATRIDSVTDNCVVVVCVTSTNNLPVVADSTSIISNRFLTTVESDTPGKLATLNDRIYIKLPRADMTGTDLAAAKQWLANNPTQIVYKLTTPIHMQLSSTLNIQSYVGRNNFFSDGAIVEAEYEYIESQDLMWRKRIVQNAAHPAHAEPGAISGAPSITRFETDIAAPLKNCVVYFEPQQEGSGDPSPSNVRSFKAGYTGARITIAGKNLYKLTNWQNTVNGVTYIVNNGVIAGSGTATTANSEFYFKSIQEDYIPAGNYLFSVDGLIDTWNDTLIWDSTAGGRSRSWDGTKDAASDNYMGRFQFYEVAVVEGHTQSQMIRIRNGESVTNHSWYPMFCMPDETDLTFEPFIGNKYSYNWQSSAGTIYGGQLDLKTGILTVTHQLISLGTPAQSKSRITSISKRSTGMTTFWFWFARSGSVIEGRDMATDKYILCDKLKPGSTANDVTYSTVPTISNYAANVYPGSLYLSAPTAEVGTTTDSIWTWMLANPFQIVTHLKTPLTYQLDPITINALKGKNNMWSDNGKVSIEYWTH